MSVEFRITPRDDLLVPRIEKVLERMGARTVYDLGGGANPILSQDIISARGLRYLLVDSSEDQLALAPGAYIKVHLDPASTTFRAPEPGDLVLSRFVLEHLDDPASFHRNVLNLLKPGGRAIHFFSTLYALPFVVNRVLPASAATRLLRALQPARQVNGRQAKFPAHYRWCRGPNKRQLRRFSELGFEVDSYIGFFGHHYLNRFPHLQGAEDRLAQLLVRLACPALTSYALVELRRPQR